VIRFIASRRPPSDTASQLLNLGCGSRRHPAWTNADLVPAGPDVIACDLRRQLPFAASSFRAVYAAHVLEHLEPVEARRLVAEMFRVLAPGGIVRIVVPDLEGTTRAYLASLDRAVSEATPEARWEHRWMTVELLDQLVRSAPGGVMRRWWSCEPVPARGFIESRLGQEAATGIAAVAATLQTRGESPLDPAAIFAAEPPAGRTAARYAARGERHRWMYDRVSLADLLAEAGFADLQQTDAVSSRIPEFAAACLDADEQGRARKPDSLYFEGARP
jgi:predicted SAM-dependent methyltransferase